MSLSGSDVIIFPEGETRRPDLYEQVPSGSMRLGIPLSNIYLSCD